MAHPFDDISAWSIPAISLPTLGLIRQGFYDRMAFYSQCVASGEASLGHLGSETA